MEKDTREVKVKRRLKKRFKILLLIIFIIIYAFFIGTKGIFVKEFKVETNNITKEMENVKILQFSDLHYGTVNMKMVNKLISKINETKPDIVIFTGDLIDEKYDITEYEKEVLKKNLSNINSEYGKYYVTGEEDYEETSTLLNQADFINLNDLEQTIYLQNSSKILLIGKDKIKEYFELNTDENSFKLLAVHNPNDYDKLKKENFDMVLAGHTHNGQLNIYKLKDLLIKGKYKDSYYKIDNTNLYINPGIGNSKIKARLFNHPTIYLYRLYSKK